MSSLTEAAVSFTSIADALPKIDSSLYLTFVLLMEARSALTVTPMATVFTGSKTTERSTWLRPLRVSVRVLVPSALGARQSPGHTICSSLMEMAATATMPKPQRR